LTISVYRKKYTFRWIWHLKKDKKYIITVIKNSLLGDRLAFLKAPSTREMEGGEGRFCS
jgi:hypothetical protein